MSIGNIVKISNVTITMEGAVGENDWYVSCVNITFDYNPEEIDTVFYQVNDGNWTVYSDMFQVCSDRYHQLLWYYIDIGGNQSVIKQVDFKIDQTGPDVDYTYQFIEVENDTALIEFDATATDGTSGMNRVEFICGGELKETIYGLGPKYVWITIIDYDYSIQGIISNRNINDEYVTFLAIAVSVLIYNDTFAYPPKVYGYDNAGNYAFDFIPQGPAPPTLKLFKRYNFTNNYEGYIGNYYINADFKEYPIEGSVGLNDINLRLIENFQLLNLLLQRLTFSL